MNNTFVADCDPIAEAEKIISEAEKNIYSVTGQKVRLQQVEESPKLTLTWDILAGIIVKITEISYERITSKTRKREVVIARHLLFYYAGTRAKMIYRIIGEKTGQRDHTSVIHGRDSIKDHIDTKDHIVMPLIRAIEEELKSYY